MKHQYKVCLHTMSFVFYQNQVLLQKASQAKDWSGKFNTIGGHVEAEEDVLQAANREIFEESGLKPQNTRLSGIVHVTNFFGINILMLVTSSEVNTQHVTPNHEGELEWIDIDQIGQLNTFADIKPLLHQVVHHPNHLFTATSKFNHQNKLEHLKIHN